MYEYLIAYLIVLCWQLPTTLLLIHFITSRTHILLSILFIIEMDIDCAFTKYAFNKRYLGHV